MARPRRHADETPLFVRIPAAEAAKLHHASSMLGAPKRELITRLVARYVDPDDMASLSELGGSEFGVGQHSFRPAEELEILTPAQLAGLLQIEEEVVGELAQKQELPGRKIGEEGRFSREAILAWLAEGGGGSGGSSGRGRRPRCGRPPGGRSGASRPACS